MNPEGTMPGRRGRPRTAWMDNIKTWSGLPVEESIRMTGINGESTSMVWPTIGSRTAKEQNRNALTYRSHLQVIYRPTSLPPLDLHSHSHSREQYFKTLKCFQKVCKLCQTTTPILLDAANAVKMWLRAKIF